MTMRPLFAVALVTLFFLATPQPAWAQQFGCELVSASPLIFGPISANPTAAQGTTADVSVLCTGNGGERGLQLKVCVGIVPDGQRKMTNASAQLDYRIQRSDGMLVDEGNDAAFVIITLGQEAQPTGLAKITLNGLIAPGQSGLLPGTYSEAVPGRVRSSLNLQLGCASAQDWPAAAFQIAAQAEIASSCTIVANDLSFGTRNSLAAVVDSTTTLGLTCSVTTPYSVRLNGGDRAGNAAARKLGLNGAGVGVVAYELRHTNANGPIWGDGNTTGTEVVSGTGTGAPQTLTVFGRVPVQATPPVGYYADTVTATVVY